MIPKSSPFLSLKIPVFRYFLLGTFISEIGNQMQIVAVSWQVYELTRNPVSLGLIGLATFLPVLLFSLVGGLIADKLDRKKLLIVGHSFMAVFTFVLFILSLTHLIQPWMIYLILILNSTASSFALPARQAVLPNLVPKPFFMNAISLHSLQFQSATMIGPAIAGFLIGGLGVPAVYFFNALSFIFFIISVWVIKDPLNASKEVEFSVNAIHRGLKFVLTTPILYSTMILDFLATFFGTATILMPVFAKEVLHVGPTGLGLLYSAPAIGAIVAGLFLSSMNHRIKHHGRIILVSVFLYGLATIGFGLSKLFWLSIFFMSMVGFWDMVSSVIRNTIRQMITPDHLRGRMVSIMRIFFMGGPQLGDIEAGLLAAAVGGPASVVIGGLGTMLVTSALAYFSPKLRNYQGKDLAV